MPLAAKRERHDREFQTRKTRSRGSYTPSLHFPNSVRWPLQESARIPQHPTRVSPTTEFRHPANPLLGVGGECRGGPAKVHRSSRLASSIRVSTFGMSIDLFVRDAT